MQPCTFGPPPDRLDIPPPPCPLLSLTLCIPTSPARSSSRLLKKKNLLRSSFVHHPGPTHSGTLCIISHSPPYHHPNGKNSFLGLLLHSLLVFVQYTLSLLNFFLRSSFFVLRSAHSRNHPKNGPILLPPASPPLSHVGCRMSDCVFTMIIMRTYRAVGVLGLGSDSLDHSTAQFSLQSPRTILFACRSLAIVCTTSSRLIPLLRLIPTPSPSTPRPATPRTYARDHDTITIRCRLTMMTVDVLFMFIPPLPRTHAMPVVRLRLSAFSSVVGQLSIECGRLV
jgi:hypothetical protein